MKKTVSLLMALLLCVSMLWTNSLGTEAATVSSGDFYFAHVIAGRMNQENVDISEIRDSGDSTIQFDLSLMYGYQVTLDPGESSVSFFGAPELQIIPSDPQMSVDYRLDQAKMLVTFPADVEVGKTYTITCKAFRIPITIDGIPQYLPLNQSTVFTINIVSDNSGNTPVNNFSAPAQKILTDEEIAIQKAEALAKALEETIKAETAMTVESFVSKEAVAALPAEVKESSNAQTVYNLSNVTTVPGFIAAIEKIAEANKAANAGAVMIYSSDPITFNADMLTALADAAAEFVYMFRYKGHLYKISIPAGVKIDLEGQVFAGPLYIGAKLGTAVLVK